MIINDVRKNNLIRLIGNPAEQGAVSKFASRHNLNPDQIRHLVTGYRSIGEKLARKLELEIGLSQGELDTDYQAMDDESVIAIFKELSLDKRKIAAELIISLSKLKTRLKAGD